MRTECSLTSQLRVLALSAAATDVVLFSLNGLPESALAKVALFGALIVGSGLALVLPPRFAGYVWIFITFVQATGAWAFRNEPVIQPVAPAAFLVAGLSDGGVVVLSACSHSVVRGDW